MNPLCLFWALGQADRASTPGHDLIRTRVEALGAPVAGRVQNILASSCSLAGHQGPLLSEIRQLEAPLMSI